MCLFVLSNMVLSWNYFFPTRVFRQIALWSRVSDVSFFTGLYFVENQNRRTLIWDSQFFSPLSSFCYKLIVQQLTVQKVGVPTGYKVTLLVTIPDLSLLVCKEKIKLNNNNC